MKIIMMQMIMIIMIIMMMMIMMMMMMMMMMLMMIVEKMMMMIKLTTDVHIQEISNAQFSETLPVSLFHLLKQMLRKSS